MFRATGHIFVSAKSAPLPSWQTQQHRQVHFEGLSHAVGGELGFWVLTVVLKKEEQGKLCSPQSIQNFYFSPAATLQPNTQAEFKQKSHLSPSVFSSSFTSLHSAAASGLDRQEKLQSFCFFYYFFFFQICVICLSA